MLRGVKSGFRDCRQSHHGVVTVQIWVGREVCLRDGGS